MNKPNQKLATALETFFLVKVAELGNKYHFDQSVSYPIYKSGSTYYYLNIDDKGIFFSEDIDCDRRYAKNLEELAARWGLGCRDAMYNHFYYGFYSNYAAIIKTFDAKQKEQDDLYKAVARFENREKPATEFAL